MRHFHQNPDSDIRALERAFRGTQSLDIGVRLLAEYVRAGDLVSTADLFPRIERQYWVQLDPLCATCASQGSRDLSVEAVLIQAHLSLGLHPADLCVPRGTIYCKYDKPLIWDILAGYPMGFTQSWVDEINRELVRRGWVEKPPRMYQDSERPDATQVREPVYSFGLLFPPERSTQQEAIEQTWFRVFWSRIFLPDINKDAPYTMTKLLVEDEPRFHPGPRANLSYIRDCASGGRTSYSSTYTKRVLLSVGVPLALDTLEMLANCIYFAPSSEETFEYSGLETFEVTSDSLRVLRELNLQVTKLPNASL